MGQQVIEVAGALADQMGEYLALLLARQVRAGGRGRQVELRRIARVVGHGTDSGTLNPLALRDTAQSSKGKGGGSGRGPRDTLSATVARLSAPRC